MSAQKDIHVKVDGEFHEEFLAALKKLRWKTQSSFFQHAMRELIKEAESRRAVNVIRPRKTESEMPTTRTRGHNLG